MKLLTRKDTDVGNGAFDSIAWAFSEHLGYRDTGAYQSAVLHGNEDSPDKIEFYLQAEPTVNDKPELIWTREPAMPHASDCAYWVGERCDCATGKDAR